MAELDKSSVKTAFRGVKGAIAAKVELVPGSGKVWPRIRYANDLKEWLEIAAVERVAGIQVLRAVFIYLRGFETTRVEGCKRLYKPNYSIEIVQAFEDGTDEDNSTARFEDFLGDVAESFGKDLYLGFTSGEEVTHDEIQAGEGDGRPEWVDAVLAHRKTLTLAVGFKI